MKQVRLRVEKRGAVAFIWLCEAKRGNVIDDRLQRELLAALGVLEDDEQVRAVVLCSAVPSVFCVGSVSSGANSPFPSDAGDGPKETNVWERVAEFAKPTVAAICGKAIGAGLELALACDIRLCSDSATFGLPEVSLGLLPSHGGTQRLPRTVGRGKALEMILTGEVIDANEALRVGLVSRLVGAGELDAAAGEVGCQLAANAPVALRYARQAVVDGAEMSFEQGLHLEMDLYALLQTTGDRDEGLRAFKEKRLPTYEGE